MTTTAVREFGIVLGGESVCAILEGRKTQLRRIAVVNDELAASMLRAGIIDSFKEAALKISPFHVGLRLWVKESYVIQCGQNGHKRGRYCDGQWFSAPTTAETHPGNRTIGSVQASQMKKWASRITLQIVKVRIERLQEISEGDSDTDVRREGISGGGRVGRLKQFIEHWDANSGVRLGCSWDENPWVWVIEFKRQT